MITITSSSGGESCPSDVTLPPPGEAIVSDELPGFAVKVRISAASSDPILGHEEEEWIRRPSVHFRRRGGAL